MMETSDVLSALLDAHVHHELSRLDGDALDHLLEQDLAASFHWLRDVKVNDVVTREQIVGVIQRYVIDLDVSGGITELAGQMANAVFSSKISLSTKVSEVCPPESYEEFADKIVALETAQREIIRYLLQSPAFGVLSSRVASRLALDLLLQREGSHRESLMLGVVSALRERVISPLERRFAAAVSRYAERHAERLTKAGEEGLLEMLEPEWVRRMVDEVWDAVSNKTLSEAFAALTPQDLEDFVILGYEFWLKFRKTDYFRTVSTEVVDRIFAKYGDESLLSLIEDMGVTEQMVLHELKTFLRPLVRHARRTGFLEAQLRTRLEPFYRSAAAAAIVQR